MNGSGQYGISRRPAGRGNYGSAPVVGLKIYHSVGDRAEAVKQMAIDWTALYQNLASQVGEITADPRSPSGYRIATQRDWDANPPDPKRVTWWKSYGKPVFDAWVNFKSEHLGSGSFMDDWRAWTERFWTDWDVYEDWKKKLDALRAEAAKQGFAISAPVATPLPTTVWADAASTVERGAGAVASGAGDVWKVLKFGVWGALGIGAVVALSSVAQNLRSGRDPAEKYMELIRGRRGRDLPSAVLDLEPAADREPPPLPAKLPPRALRALPPGAPEAA